MMSVQAVKQLYPNLTEPPILALSNAYMPFTTENDACEKQVRCAVLQPQSDEKDLRRGGYWTGSFNESDRQYDTTQRQCLVVV